MIANTPAIRVRRTRLDEWRRVREMRIEMLTDTPSAYAVTLEHTLAEPEEHWHLRAMGNPDGTSLPVIAEHIPTGVWVGAAAGVIFPGHAIPDLVGVYVKPAWRGEMNDILGLLLTPIEAWATPLGGLNLLVHDANLRARRAYEKRGFMATGYSEAHLLPPYGQDIAMRKVLPHQN